MAPRDRGRRGRSEYGRTSQSDKGRERAERDRKERERKDRSERNKDRRQQRSYKESQKYKEHMEKVRREREAEAKKAKRGSQRELRERRERQERWQRDRDRERSERQKRQQDRSVWDRMTDTVSDFFTGKETTGVGAVGGPRSYGMSKKAFDTSIGRQRHAARSLDQRLGREVDYFQEAPLDYLSDLLDNPLVAGGVMMSGLGIPAFGVKVLDAGLDIYQNEASPLEALADVGAGALSFTPVGQALPSEVRTVAKAGLQGGFGEALQAGTGLLGGKIGAGVGGKLASAFTDNPLAKAGITAAAAAAGTYGGKKAAEKGLEEGAPGEVQQVSQQVARRKPRESRRDRGYRQSPLVASGEKAIAASEQLRQQAGPSDLYARTVETLPFYGLQPQGQQEQYYGV